MDSQSTTQAIVVPQDALDSDQLSERLALFNEDGTPYTPAGGGSGGSVLYVKEFTFAVPNLAAGVPILTPAVGDILLDAWIEVVTVWDGTTPKASITDSEGGDYLTYTPRDLTVPDYSGDGNYLAGGDGGADPGEKTGYQQAGDATNFRFLPAKVLVADPVTLTVSQTGAIGGPATGATVGVLRAYVNVIPVANIVTL